MDTSNDTVLITGGGSGIGRALAQALYAKGAKVIIAGRREEALAEVCASCPGMAFETLDVADPADVKRFAVKVMVDHADLNVIVSNAGVMKREGLVEAFDLTVVDEIVATNLLGTIRLAAAFLPHLLSKPSATFVTVSSGLAFVPMAATPTYSASKAGIHSWTQSLRSQLTGTSVKVIEWAPPAVATDLMPGQAQNPNAMPLADFIAESLSLFEAGHDEILVERVKFLHGAQQRGTYDQVFSRMNGAQSRFP